MNYKIQYEGREFWVGEECPDPCFSFEELKLLKKNDRHNNEILINAKEVFPGCIMWEEK